MQREDVLEHALTILEQKGLANTTLEMVAIRAEISLNEMKRFWPDSEAIVYDALRYHSQQIESWRRQLMFNDELTAEEKVLARYKTLGEYVNNHRYPGCLFIAACTFYPDASHPIHQLAQQQKQASWAYTHELLTQIKVDDPSMVALQMELIMEGCLSKLLVNRRIQDIDTARRLAEDVLRFAQCRTNGALT